MILIGQYDSPYVRRVAMSLVFWVAYEHDTGSVFADLDAMRRINPLGRNPSLVLDDGETRAMTRSRCGSGSVPSAASISAGCGWGV
jgi:glutathione S-transferase